MKHCSNRALRETLHRAYVVAASQPPHDNVPVIHEILCLRKEQAQLLGLDSFAELSLATKMAPSVEAVETMIESLQGEFLAASKAEIASLEAFATTHGQPEQLQAWDIAYWSEQVQRADFDFKEEDVAQYFPLQRVLDAIFELTKQLFGVRIEMADGKVDTWHPDVHFFEMRAMDEPGEPVIAAFYLDLFARPGEKIRGAWMEAFVNRSEVFGTETMHVRVPVYCLGVNLTQPTYDGPCLMTVRDLTLLFNVFGYGLRMALTCANYTASSSPNVIEWDCFELTGELMKKFLFDRETMQAMSGHVVTGEPLTDAMFDNLVASMRMMEATEFLRRKVQFAAADMALHHHYDPVSNPDASIFDVYAELAPRFQVVAPLADDRILCRLIQIFSDGCGASYYGYVWSDMLASDTYAEIEKAKTCDARAKCGRKFRDTVLALSGSVDSNQLFESFLGRPPNPEALLNQLGFTQNTIRHH
ncbi:Aste57867_22262 [Aphanomyces stellatus]|uniref:Aste57867_22262 protein n=1 Tax=Aphanomyces stellatus TaxID=120398 RepID=A0A485LL47_9STRA|nr:hypothetical protein As57867_022192 [Aphanomyces stellatus]VFT98929.1 Aste57867_22262 [Aphanomyces stellatus]